MNEIRLRRLLPQVGTPVGHTRAGIPVYPFVGAAKDEGLGVEADDPEDDDPEGGEGDKWTPPTRAEWLRTQAALVKSNASAKQRREALAAAEAEIQKHKDAEAAREAKAERDALAKGAPAKKKAAGRGGGVPLPEGTMTPAQIRQLTAQTAREAEAKALEKARTQVVGHAARAALVDAGVSKSTAARLSKLLDLDDIGIDEDGEITDGLDEQIAQLRAEMPQLFAAPEPKKTARRQPPGRANGADRPAGEGEQRLSSAERMARQALGART